MRVNNTIMIVLGLTLSACGSMRITDNAALTGERTPTSATRQYSSIGILSDTPHVNDGALLEAKLSDQLFDRNIRSLTATTLFPGTDNKNYNSLVKVLKRDNFTALLVIKNMDIQTETIATQNPLSVVQNNANLKDKLQANPFQTISADIEFIDLADNRQVWSGKLTFQDSSLVPILLEKTAAGIAEHLAEQKLITADKSMAGNK